MTAPEGFTSATPPPGFVPATPPSSSSPPPGFASASPPPGFVPATPPPQAHPHVISTPHDYDAYIEAAAKKHGIDVNLLRQVGMQESGLGSSSAYDPKTGHSRDPNNPGHGLWQLDPGSGASQAVLDRAAKDPAFAADYAAGMLANALKKSGGDPKKALAIYNSGKPDSSAGLAYADSVLGRQLDALQIKTTPTAPSNPFAGAVASAGGSSATHMAKTTPAPRTPKRPPLPFAGAQVVAKAAKRNAAQERVIAQARGLDTALQGFMGQISQRASELMSPFKAIGAVQTPFSSGGPPAPKPTGPVTPQMGPAPVGQSLATIALDGSAAVPLARGAHKLSIGEIGSGALNAGMTPIRAISPYVESVFGGGAAFGPLISAWMNNQPHTDASGKWHAGPAELAGLLGPLGSVMASSDARKAYSDMFWTAIKHHGLMSPADVSALNEKYGVFSPGNIAAMAKSHPDQPGWTTLYYAPAFAAVLRGGADLAGPIPDAGAIGDIGGAAARTGARALDRAVALTGSAATPGATTLRIIGQASDRALAAAKASKPWRVYEQFSSPFKVMRQVHRDALGNGGSEAEAELLGRRAFGQVRISHAFAKQLRDRIFNGTTLEQRYEIERLRQGLAPEMEDANVLGMTLSQRADELKSAIVNMTSDQLAAGVLKPEQVKDLDVYVSHAVPDAYRLASHNQDVMEYQSLGRRPTTGGAVHTAHQVNDTFDQMRWGDTANLERDQRVQSPIFDPKYDPADGFEYYIAQRTKKVGLSNLYQEMSGLYGKDLDFAVGGELVPGKEGYEAAQANARKLAKGKAINEAERVSGITKSRADELRAKGEGVGKSELEKRVAELEDTIAKGNKARVEARPAAAQAATEAVQEAAPPAAQEPAEGTLEWARAQLAKEEEQPAEATAEPTAQAKKGAANKMSAARKKNIADAKSKVTRLESDHAALQEKLSALHTQRLSVRPDQAKALEANIKRAEQAVADRAVDIETAKKNLDYVTAKAEEATAKESAAASPEATPAKAVEEPPVHDKKGNALAVGDHVRYGKLGLTGRVDAIGPGMSLSIRPDNNALGIRTRANADRVERFDANSEAAAAAAPKLEDAPPPLKGNLAKGIPPKDFSEDMFKALPPKVREQWIDAATQRVDALEEKLADTESESAQEKLQEKLDAAEEHLYNIEAYHDEAEREEEENATALAKKTAEAAAPKPAKAAAVSKKVKAKAETAMKAAEGAVKRGKKVPEAAEKAVVGAAVDAVVDDASPLHKMLQDAVDSLDSYKLSAADKKSLNAFDKAFNDHMETAYKDLMAAQARDALTRLNAPNAEHKMRADAGDMKAKLTAGPMAYVDQAKIAETLKESMAFLEPWQTLPVPALEFLQQLHMPYEHESGMVKVLNTLNKLNRVDIIQNPVRHVFMNLLWNYLAGTGDFSFFGKRIWTDPEKWESDINGMTMSQVIDGARKNMAVESFMGSEPLISGESAGTSLMTPMTKDEKWYKPDFSKVYGETLQKKELSGDSLKGQMAGAGAVTHALLSRAWGLNQHVVFGIFEHRYAVSTYMKFLQDNLKRGMPEAEAGADAGIRTRKILGDYDNVYRTGFESRLNRLMLFYPWLKTAAPLAIKTLFVRPQMVTAPYEFADNWNKATMGPDEAARMPEGAIYVGNGQAVSLSMLPMKYAQRFTEALLPQDTTRATSRLDPLLQTAADELRFYYSPLAKIAATEFGPTAGTGHGAPAYPDADRNLIWDKANPAAQQAPFIPEIGGVLGSLASNMPGAHALASAGTLVMKHDPQALLNLITANPFPVGAGNNKANLTRYKVRQALLTNIAKFDRLKSAARYAKTDEQRVRLDGQIRKLDGTMKGLYDWWTQADADAKAGRPIPPFRAQEYTQ